MSGAKKDTGFQNYNQITKYVQSGAQKDYVLVIGRTSIHVIVIRGGALVEKTEGYYGKIAYVRASQIDKLINFINE